MRERERNRMRQRQKDRERERQRERERKQEKSPIKRNRNTKPTKHLYYYDTNWYLGAQKKVSLAFHLHNPQYTHIPPSTAKQKENSPLYNQTAQALKQKSNI